MVWGGRREDGSGWGTRVYLWWIHVDIWQNQYNIVKLKNKIKKKTKQNKKKQISQLEETREGYMSSFTVERKTESPKKAQLVVTEAKGMRRGWVIVLSQHQASGQKFLLYTVWSF